MLSPRLLWLPCTLVLWLQFSLPAQPDDHSSIVPDQPDFSRDIQPILAAKCVSCHGGVKQAAGLSFVDPASFTPPDGWVIEAGNAEDSELFARITSSDDELRMPPPGEHSEPLSDRDVEVIRRWIDQGAAWEDHWSRRPLRQPELPATTEAKDWAKQPWDRLVWRRLRELGLEPSPAAEPAQWLRRASLDLIGLPPSVQELTGFQRRLSKAASAAERDQIYSEETDRLLSSPRFGERWAAMWMDLARYADSKGFEKDPHRDIWPYRDWLIAAFNSDMPYDEFTIKQLAGDLLPGATYQDLVATAFHRNTQTNTEGGTDDEEFRLAAVIDRLNTTWTVWQATTMGCVQCHAHPYEPIENVEFYAGLALFNNTQDCDLAEDFPTLPHLANPAQQRRWMELHEDLREWQREADALAQVAIEKSDWKIPSITSIDSTAGQLALQGEEVRVVGGTIPVGSTFTLVADAEAVSALRLQILPVSDRPQDWPEQGSVLSHLRLFKLDADGEETELPIEMAVPDYRAGPYDCDETLHDNAAGFGGYPKLFRPRWMVAILTERVELQDAERLKIQLNHKASVTGGLSTHLRRFKLECTHSSELPQLSAATRMVELRTRIQEAKEELETFEGARLPIVRERTGAARRQTRQFIRGNWLERDQIVEPGVPAVLMQSLPEPLQINDRLEFARWLVSEQNPLSARVWVNRIWGELFGIGLVETVEDFGTSGAQPLHPELLDFLAYTAQVDYAWSLKSLLRSIVLSATYRQDSRASAELRERDPRNRWLARGPRTRLTAEMIRDQALFVAGKLSDKIGGPSVMPPQPEGVWQQVYSGATWKAAEGEDRFRRGLYTYWKRTSPYPGFIMFDTPTRDVCSPRRMTTNTPLQALVTLNSQVYTELAGFLAERCFNECDGDIQAAIESMFLRVTQREPAAGDLQALLALYESLATPKQIAVDSGAEPAPNLTSTDTPATPARELDESNSNEDSLSPLGSVALAILNTDWALSK